MQPTGEKSLYLLASIAVMAVSLLACKPVFAIGWNEFLFLSLLIAVLLGPPLYRFIRRVENFLKRRERDR